MSDISPRFNIRIGNAVREIFMSFGLLNELTRIVDSVSLAEGLLINTELNNEVLIALLANRNERGVVIEPTINLYTLEAEPEAITALLSWAQEHLFAFFIKRLAQMQEVLEKNRPAMQKLMEKGQMLSENGGPA